MGAVPSQSLNLIGPEVIPKGAVNLLPVLSRRRIHRPHGLPQTPGPRIEVLVGHGGERRDSNLCELFSVAQHNLSLGKRIG